MPNLQEQFDDAMFEFSTGNVDGAIAGLKAVLAQDPTYFDAQLALGGAYYAKGDYAAAIAEGHKAEKMKPHDQLVHTNLSRAYMKAGDKTDRRTSRLAGAHRLLARQHGRAARRGPRARPELEVARPKPPPVKLPEKFPDMPWKKKTNNPTYYEIRLRTGHGTIEQNLPDRRN